MSQKLSIAYVSPGWPLNQYPNGIVTYVQNMLLGLGGRQDVDAKVLAFVVGQNVVPMDRIIDLSSQAEEKSISEKIQDFLGFKVNSSYAIQNVNSRLILKTVNKIAPQFDLLELEESFGLAAKIIPYVNFPVITRLHGPWFIHAPILNRELEPSFKYRVKSEGIAIRESQGITAPSLDVLRQVRAFYNLDLSNAKVIHNPVPETASSMLWNYPDCDKRMLLFVGRFDRHKGGDLVLDAFRLIALKNPEISLTFVGPDIGILRNGKKLLISEYINTYIPESNIRQRIVILGHQSKEKILALRKQALITLVTSRYETFSLSLVEALSTGSPVIATAAGAIKEIVKSGYNGILAEPESVEDFSVKIESLIADPDKMKALSKNAIDDCRLKYHPSVIAQQTLDYYQSLL